MGRVFVSSLSVGLCDVLITIELDRKVRTCAEMAKIRRSAHAAVLCTDDFGAPGYGMALSLWEEKGYRRAEMRACIIPELLDARMAFEGSLHDAALNAPSAAVDQPHF